jgi:ferredoxin
MSDERPISRRDLLRGRLFRRVAETVADGLTSRLEQAEQAARAVRSNLPTFPQRPPGAVPERAFITDCTRCDACVAACPVGAIVLAPARYGDAAGTPVIEPLAVACVMCRDMPCIDACQSEGSGVLDPARPQKMGTARIRESDCTAYQDSFCSACFVRCPVSGAIEHISGRPVIHEDICTGCGMCWHACPAPTNAIEIEPLPERPSIIQHTDPD